MGVFAIDVSPAGVTAGASHLYAAGQTSGRPAGTHLVTVLVRQRAFPACDAEPQTAPLARHFDLQLKVCAQSKT